MNYRFLLALLLMVLIVVESIEAVPGQVIIINHAEKDEQGQLTQKGLERAGALAAYFSLTSVFLNFGQPIAVFAARPTSNQPPFGVDDNTQRCIETIAPTAEFLKLPIHCGFDKLDYKKLVNYVMNNDSFNKKNVLICWQRDQIANLLKAFKVNSSFVYPKSQFDLTLVITFLPQPNLKIYEQQLLYGDQKVNNK